MGAQLLNPVGERTIMRALQDRARTRHELQLLLHAHPEQLAFVLHGARARGLVVHTARNRWALTPTGRGALSDLDERTDRAFPFGLARMMSTNRAIA